MPRRPRINVPGLVYHVINRGVKQLSIFHDDEDRLEFLDWLKDSGQRYPLEVHQYSLMTNHYHLLLRPLEECVSTPSLTPSLKVLSWHIFNFFEYLLNAHFIDLENAPITFKKIKSILASFYPKISNCFKRFLRRSNRNG